MTMILRDLFEDDFDDDIDLDLEAGPADPDWEAFYEFQELDRIDYETSIRFRSER